MARKQGFSGFRPKLVSLAVASCFATGAALANPTNPQVVHGAANFTNPAANVLNITTATPQTIINWGGFSIAAGELTKFLQPSAASAVLNRVIGSGGAIDPSVILGALQSNGRVFLVNPSGILFGAGAQIDVAGLVATSMNLSNADFLANRLKFTEVPGAGSVINQGNITTGQGGQVYLVGPAVANNGIITSPKGEVVLAAGNTVELVNPGTPNLRVEITAAENEAKNLGSIIVDSGRAGIYAGLVNNSGTIRANSASVTEDGRIVLQATKNTTLAAGSVTTANGPAGGSVTIQSGDTTLVTGTVEAKGASGQGGTVQILGDKVGVYGSALVDASGNAGGGTVLVGGDFQGKNPDIQNATATYFGSGATLRADAGQSGDGGKVIVWADDTTRAYGTITARGGAQSGDGGFVEVSGKQFLDFNASVNTTAPNGLTGTLLLDPNTLIIQDGAGTLDGPGPTFTSSAEPSTLSVGAINAVGATTSVVINATDQITINPLGVDINIAAAGQSITLNSTTSGGITFVDPNDKIITNNGGIFLTATGTGTLSNLGGLVSNGGMIQLVGQGGVSVGSGATIDAGAGNLNIYSSGVVSLAPAATVNGANVLLSTYATGKFQINSAGVAVGTNFVTTPADLARISVTTPASGVLTLRAQSGGNDLEFNAPVTLDPAKVATLMLQPKSTAQVTQNISAPLSVQKLAVDGGEGGNVTMLANNMVGTLAYNKPSFSCCNGDSFQFKNGQSLTIGSAGGFNGITAQGYNSATPFVVSVDVTGDLSVVKGITVTGASGSPTGQTVNLNLSATGTFSVTDENINANGGAGTVQGSASTTISGQGGVNLTAANVSSLGGASAAVTIASSGGNINLGDGQISAFGTAPGSSGAVTVSAPNGSIVQGTGGSLSTSGITEAIVLQARDGIGTPAAPLRIGDGFSNVFGSITATNTGTSGDIALQFGEFIFIDNNAANLSNANPNGTYYLRVNPGEGSGRIELSTPFLPGGGLLPGQRVHLAAPAVTGSGGDIRLVGGGTGSITGGAQVTLEAGDLITLDAGTSINSSNVLLKGNRMNVQGMVTASNNVYVTPFTAGRQIDLGTVGDAGSVLALDAAELSRFNALGLGIGTDGTTANTGPLVVQAPIGPFNAFPNLFASTITQPSGAGISSPGGLNVFTAGGDVELTAPTNNIGSFGGISDSNVTLVTTGDVSLGALQASGLVTITSLGGAILNTSGLANITAPSVSLSAATGIGSVLPIMLTNASPSGVTAINSTSGGIGLLQPNGTITLGSGGWNVQNAPGGEIIIEGMNITLGAGAPNSGPLEIFASNEAIVGPAGYASTNPLFLSGLNHVNVNGNLSASNLALFAGESVNINGAAVTATGLAAVAATKLNVTAGTTAASLTAGDLVAIVGEINLQGGTGTNAYAEIKAGPGVAPLFITTFASGGTTGNINLNGGAGSGAYARIYGDPDVGSLLLPVSVGGAINMTQGTGAGSYARIESASANSIFVDFLNFTSGGFFVNGVENAVSSGGSGFFAGGQPAVLGQNLLVTYGGLGSLVGGLSASELAGVEQAINQVIVATNNTQSDLIGGNVTGSEGGVTDPKEEKDKKGLPVCGK